MQSKYLKLLAEVKSGNTTFSQYYQELSRKIKQVNDEHNVFITINDSIEDLAIEADKKISTGNARPLEGFPIAIKDNIAVKGMKLTCASQMLDSFISPYDAIIIQQLIDNGAIIIGKANLDEFAMGANNTSSFYGKVTNSLNPEVSPGGSSGGSAVAVQTEVAIIALGTDTGGSVRQPASLCGIIGFKPTFDMLPLEGVVSLASSMDTLGFMATTIEDITIVYEKLINKQLAVEPEELGGKKFALLTETMDETLSKEVRQAINSANEALTKLGASVEMVSLPELELVSSAYFVLVSSEAVTNLARYEGIRYGHQINQSDKNEVKKMVTMSRNQGFGKEVKKRIVLGNYFLSHKRRKEYYEQAQKIRTAIYDSTQKILANYDFILTPTTSQVAQPFTQVSDSIQKDSSTRNNALANLVGLPAISIPLGKTTENLPMGLQIIAAKGEDAKLLAISEKILNEVL